MNRRAASFSGRSQQRAGLFLAEAVAALTLMGVMLLFLVPLLTATRRAGRDVERRERALDLASNLIENISAHHREEKVTDEWLQQLQLPTAVEDELPGAKLQIEMQANGALPAVRVELTWENDQGTRPTPVELTVWLP